MGAQFGRILGTVIDSQGRPVSGATVEVRTQGAFVISTQAGPTYTVDDVGGIVVTQQIGANLGTANPACTVVTETDPSVTLGVFGLGTLNNGDRLTVINPLPTLYTDAQGNETVANPLTTNASGQYSAWAPILPYDYKISGTGFGTKLLTDQVPMGQEDVASNAFPFVATTPVFRRSSTRTLSTGRLQTWENPRGTVKAYVDVSGNLVAVNGTFSGTLGVTGNVTLSGTLGVTGLSTLTGGASIGTSLTYSGAAGNLSLTAGSIETADLAANAVVATRIGTGTTDQTLTAGAAYADVVSATVTFTPFSSASEIVISANVPSESSGAGGFTAFARIVDGAAATIYHEAGTIEPTATANLPVVIPLLARITGLTGSQTFKVQAKCLTNNSQILSSSTDRKCKIVAMEFKK